MAVVLGLLAALAYGASDFVGGQTSKRASAVAVSMAAQLVALAVLLIVLPFAAGHLSAGTVGWSVLAGAGSGLGGLFLYRGLSTARMNVVAPLSGVIAALLPAVVGIGTGDRPGALALVGIAVALAAIVLVSLTSQPAEPGRSSGVPEGLGAGLGFGAAFVGLQRPGPDAGVWPLVLNEVFAIVAVLLAGLLVRERLWPGRSAAPGAVVSGALVAGAVLSYLYATRYGLLSVVAVLVSLYPALTVILAAVVLRERSTKVQLIGMLGAAVAVSLITVA